MKKTSILVKNGIVLSLLTATLLHATNGDNLIAVGTKARGMGGTGIAISHGAESTLSNPAMITSLEGTEISFGGTLFMPDISTSFQGNGMVPSQDAIRSDADRNIIPEVSIAHKINDNWYIGAGMFGTAGMGTDYRSATLDPMMGKYGNFNMVTNLQLLQFAIPVAYKYEGFSVAVSGILQYGNLDINYRMPGSTGIADIGAGLAQDFGFGWNAGIAYDFSTQGVDGLTLGAMYKSKIKMTYDQQISTAAAPINGFINAVGGGYFDNIYAGDVLEQPAEFGIGMAYETGAHTIAFDYKNVQWSSAQGYGDFGWEDQDVYAVGYQYSQDNWALRLGYNYASSAVVEQSGAAMTDAAFAAQSANNFFNLLAFPATAEQHYTFGGTYALTEAFAIDLAYVYSPTNTETFQTAAFGGNPPNGFGLTSITTTHQEDSLSFQLTYNF